MSTRAQLSIAFVAALGLVPSGLGAASCSSQTCNLSDCGDGLNLKFDETVPRDYTLSVTINGETRTADCTAAVDPDTTAEVTAEIADLETSVTCGTDGLTFSTSPDRVTVVITFAGGFTTTVNADPAYEDYVPEGTDCDEPICRRATYDMDINPPTG